MINIGNIHITSRMNLPKVVFEMKRLRLLTVRTLLDNCLSVADLYLFDMLFTFDERSLLDW